MILYREDIILGIESLWNVVIGEIFDFFGVIFEEK